MKSLKYKLLLGGILSILLVTMTFLGQKETNFHKISENINVFSLTITVNPEGYGSPDWDFENGERPVNHYVDLTDESQEFHEILSILSPYTYEKHENSTKTKNRSFENSQDAEIILIFNAVNRIFGFPLQKDYIILSDLGDMNVNKHTYKMNGDAALDLMEKLLTYLEENPALVRTA